MQPNLLPTQLGRHIKACKAIFYFFSPIISSTSWYLSLLPIMDYQSTEAVKCLDYWDYFFSHFFHNSLCIAGILGFSNQRDRNCIWNRTFFPHCLWDCASLCLSVPTMWTGSAHHKNWDLCTHSALKRTQGCSTLSSCLQQLLPFVAPLVNQEESEFSAKICPS